MYKRWTHNMDPYDRVMARLVPGPGDCMVFSGTRTTKGYGQIRTGGTTVRTHRLVLEHHTGPRPGMLALHSCDNPPCCNIDHLRWGTHRQNTADMLARGRDFQPSTAVLTEDDVRAIRRNWSTERGHASRVAREYGVTAETIYALRDRRTWRNVH